MTMSLSNGQLDAFYEVAKVSSFSQAAQNLGVTQSALSQRIKNLEFELGTSLLIREPAGTRLTPAGENLVQYCTTKAALEAECLVRIQDPKALSLSGTVRLAGYSTVMRSLALPALSPLLNKNTDLRLEFLTREMRELPKLLRSGETDFILLDHALEKEGVESILLGHEEYVLIESKKNKSRTDHYLDHDLEDHTTLRFFEAQGKNIKNLQRTFLDDIYAIIDATDLGVGRSVVPRHLIVERKAFLDNRVQIVAGYRPLKIPVYLCFYQQPFYSKLHNAMIKSLTSTLQKELEN